MSRTPPTAARAVAIAAAITVVLALVASWFAWPARELEPRDLPVVVAGPPPVAAAVADQLRAERPGAFEVTTVGDAAAADQKLRGREAYAAFVVGAEGVSLHVASAASPIVSGLLTQAAQQLGSASGRPVQVVDVVPGGPDDPRGSGLGSGFLPLVLASMIVGIVLALQVPDKLARLLGLVAFAVFAGLVGSAVLNWLGLVAGSYFAVAGAIGLLALAVSSTVSGLAAVLGPPGIGLGVLTVFLFGNPISAIAAAPELLPQPWGEIGQLLPPGAGATLLRSAAFFDGAGTAAPLWTLLAWAAAGLALLALGRATAAPRARTQEVTLEGAAA